MKSIRIQRILFLVLSAAFVFGKMHILLVYVTIYYLSFEYLNSNKKYLEIGLHKMYNWLYVVYLAFIVFVRSGLFKFQGAVDYNLNTAEHLFFMFLICQTVLVYMQLFNFLNANYLSRLISVFAILNLIGIINEYFQNVYQHLPVFYLEKDDLKDLSINLIGSSLFVIISVIYNRKKMLKFNISKIKL